MLFAINGNAPTIRNVGLFSRKPELAVPVGGIFDGSGVAADSTLLRGTLVCFSSISNKWHQYFHGFTTTGNITTGSNQLTNLASVANLVVGLGVSGAGIPASTVIQSISGSTVTLSNNATATTTGLTVTFADTVAVNAVGIVQDDTKVTAGVDAPFTYYREGYFNLADVLDANSAAPQSMVVGDLLAAAGFRTLNPLPGGSATELRLSSI